MFKPYYVPWLILAPAGALAVVLWLSGTSGASRRGIQGPPAGPDHATEKHYVSPRQLADSNAPAHQVLDLRSVRAADGRTRRWDDLSSGRPVVLVFIKHGCPCSVEFEPFFQRVERLYHDAVRFVGVIDASMEKANDYVTRQHVPYPVLADPRRRIIRQLRAENGGYFALLTPAGEIDGFWPGCSADALRELGQRIAHLAGREDRPLDTTGMPGPLTTGSPYES
jgi:peroxiredoxin